MTGDDGKVIPLHRRRPVPDRRLHPAARRGSQGARDVAAAQNAVSGEAYRRAVARQRDARLLATGRPVPGRITIALDVRGMDGPAVDVACGTFEGNPDGDVDMWELALKVPSGWQVKLLSRLTGFPVPFFYLPLKPGPQLGPIIVCGRGGCHQLKPNVVTEQGVLLYEGEPRTLRPFVQAELPGMPAVPRTEPDRPRRAKQPPRTKPEPVTQPPLRSGMPQHVREELDRMFAARSKPDQSKHRPNGTVRDGL